MAKDDLISDDWDGNDNRGDYYSLSRLKMWYVDWVQVKFAERDEANQARRYYHADQIDEKAAKTLRDRRQPIIVYNREAKKINAIVGLIERLRQDPKAYPRTPAAQEGADIATAVMNYVLDVSQWRALSPVVTLDSCIEPVVGIELSLEEGDSQQPGDMDVQVERIDPRKFFYDPRARKPDLTDARYMGMSGWFDLSDAIEMFPDKEKELRASIDETTDQASAFTGDNATAWVISSSKKVRLNELWYKRNGKWLYCFYVADFKLREGVSPYIDEKGKTFPRFIVFSANVDHDFDRYGFHRNMKGPQDEVNARRSKALHQINTQRMKVTEGGFKDIDAVRDELHKPDGIVEVPPGTELDVIENTAQFQGNFELLNEAKAEIDNFGPSPALIGQSDAGASGRALQIMQQAGIAELGPFILTWKAWKLRVYRAIWNTIQRYWTAERWIRVTDDQGLAQFIQLNGLGFDQMGRPTIINAVGSLDVDIIVDEGNDHVTLMQDVFDALGQIAQPLAAAGKPIPPELIIEFAQLPDNVKKRALALLNPPPNPMQQQLQQQATQIKLADGQAEVQRKQAVAQKDKATALRTMAEARTMHSKDVKQAAEADRTAAEAEGKRQENALARLPFAMSQLGPAEAVFLHSGQPMPLPVPQ